VAAGLATTGRIPVAGDYGVFACGRCWDQLRTSVCYPNLNVKIAGAHAGVSVGADGATHQALEEIALLAALPNMTLLVPCDALETEKMARIGILEVVGPTYLRYAREATPVVTRPETPCVLAKANVIRYRGRAPRFVDAFETVVADTYANEKEDVALVACGPILAEAMRAACILKEEHDLEARVINLHTVKPLDEAAVLAAASDVGLIVTAEEHQIGGFGNLVAGAAARLKPRRKPLKMDMIGIEDRFGESGEPWDLMKVFHLTAEHIVRKALALVKSK
jgi:transketolase